MPTPGIGLKVGTPFVISVRRWLYKNSMFNKYGLKYHDCLHENERVKEALRRLPKHLVDERNFRIIRAYQCSLMKVYLPQEQWTKIEDDDYYLKPYLDEVEKEEAEKAEWARK